jgi:hypothetical protein
MDSANWLVLRSMVAQERYSKSPNWISFGYKVPTIELTRQIEPTAIQTNDSLCVYYKHCHSDTGAWGHPS